MSEFDKSYLSSSNITYVDKGASLTYLHVSNNGASVTYGPDKATKSDVKDVDSDCNHIISTSSAVQLNSKFYKKSHHLVFSQINLSTKEYDLMALLFSRIQKAHWKYYQEHENVKFTPKYRFSNQVLSDWFGVDSSQLYSLLKGPSKTLSSKPVGILNEQKKGFDFVPLFKRITYENGELIMSPNDELSDEWLTVAGGHAQVDHVIFRKLARRYSKALYEMLSRFKTSGKGKLNTLSLKDLYAGFGLLNADGEVSKRVMKKIKCLWRTV
ncbi:replication initiation protein [Pseudoalteromonas sp. KJ10-2]|uniref:replication initiation protein n=1 Tax=Psychromonas sp. KJ10-2 TaxID=3391822 RepID=UPI0039B52BEA